MSLLKKGDKVGIISCSNAIAKENSAKIDELLHILKAMELEPVLGSHVFERFSVFGGTGEERASDLMNFYRDEEIAAIFDVSGGDIANEVLSYLDFSEIASTSKAFWGYSDLTTILNAIYTKTGKESVLYQIRNLIKEDGIQQREDFSNSVLLGKDDLYRFEYDFVQGDYMEGTVVGGNLRCFLKLAGTPFWPHLNRKILLLESWGGREAQMVTYLNQLKQIGVFQQVSGILLGTFTMMEAEKRQPDIISLVKQYAGANLPIARTGQIGHGSDSKAVKIGSRLVLAKN